MPTRSPVFKAITQQPPRRPVERSTIYDDHRGSSVERGYDTAWIKLRKYKLNHDPLCERCKQQQRVTAAVMVHHIEPITVRPDLRLDYRNLSSVCAPCHQAIHACMRPPR